MQYAKAMGFCVIAIDTGSEKQGVCLNTLSAEELVNFEKGVLVEVVKSVTGAYVPTLSSLSL